MERVARTYVVFGSLVLFLINIPTKAADLHVLAPTTIRSVINELRPQFELATGHKLSVEYDVAPVVERQIEGGKAFDLVVVTRTLMDDLIRQGRVVSETRRDIGRAGAGVAVRTGSAKPEIGSADALRRTLLNAKSIAYAGEGTTGAYFLKLLDRLEISEETKPKLTTLAPGTPDISCSCRTLVIAKEQQA